MRRIRDDRPKSTHKTRSAWYRQVCGWPFRELSAEALERGLHQKSRPVAVKPAPAWNSLGPFNIGGRMTSAVVHPGDSGRVLAGSAAGGVWSVEDIRDATKEWRQVSQGLLSLAVGALAVDPADPETVYCGTGEANLTADNHPGTGLYRSSDWGGSWRRIASPSAHGIPDRIGTIAVDPSDGKRLLVGGVGHRHEARDAGGGLFRLDVSAGTCKRVAQISPDPYWCHAVAFFPGGDGRALASVTERGSRSGLWRSRDGGATWHQLSDGLPSPEKMYRASLAIAPSNPEVIYALVADQWKGVLGVFQSRDGGDSWRGIHGDHFANEVEMSYNNTIVVDPEDENRVLCGGVDLHLWQKLAGRPRRWYQVTDWHADHDHGDNEYAHADHHALLMPGGDLVYDFNDGGVDVSTNGGWFWKNRSSGLVTTMFYDLDVAPSDKKVYGGGTQDNGTLIREKGKQDFRAVTSFDGGWCAFDPSDAERFYTSTQGVVVHLHRSWREDISPPESDEVKALIWMSPLRIHPARSKTVYVPTTRIWRSKPLPDPEEENWWEAISPEFDGSAVTAFEVSSHNPDYLYAGTENGGVFVSQDRGNSWSSDLSSRRLPGAVITRLRADPRAAERVIAVVGLVGHHHVYRSEDAGETWTALGDELPDLPLRAAAFDPRTPGTIFVAGDGGIFVSRDNGTTWGDFSGELPRVPVTDLVVHEASRTLTVATYGRGIFRVKL